MGGRGEGRLCRLRGPQTPLGRVCREPLRTGRTADVAVPQLRTVPWFSWALQALLSSCQYFLTVSRGFAQTPATGAKNSARRGLRAAPGAITESTLITGEGSGRDWAPIRRRSPALRVQACVHACAIARAHA